MAGKAEKKDKDETQIERFKKKAKELGADESADSFERAFKKIVKPPKPNRR
jgi:hypothetical protein